MAKSELLSVLVLFGRMSQGTDEVIDSLARLRRQTTKTVGLAWPFCPDTVRARLGARHVHDHLPPEIRDRLPEELRVKITGS